MRIPNTSNEYHYTSKSIHRYRSAVLITEYVCDSCTIRSKEYKKMPAHCKQMLEHIYGTLSHILQIVSGIYCSINVYTKIVSVQNYEINQINVPNAIRITALTPPLLSCRSSSSSYNCNFSLIFLVAYWKNAW